MTLSDCPAERHRQVAGLFTERVRGTRSWDAPSPVAGWAARDVVRHLTEWFHGFLASGASGQCGARVEVPGDADTQTRLRRDIPLGLGGLSGLLQEEPQSEYAHPAAPLVGSDQRVGPGIRCGLP